MYGEEKHGMQCAEFEALLAEALDGRLTGEKLETFELHRKCCSICAPMYEEAESGLHWLNLLKEEEVEPPARLLNSILRATTWADLPEQAHRNWWQRLRELPGVVAALGTVAQPRFAMSFAMAFFAISLVVTITGVRPKDLRRLDLRPGAVVGALGAAEGRVEKYYENLRFVYQIQSRVRDLKRATTPAERPTEDTGPKDRKQDRSGETQRDENRYYSLDQNATLWAAVTDAPAVGQNGRWL